MADLSMFDLTGKRAIVTGGTSGIGKAVAAGLAEAGAAVVIIGRNPEVERIADEIGAVGLNGDVTDYDGIEQVFSEAVEHLGGLDILVNSAGALLKGDSVNLDMQRWQWLMNLNVGSVMHMCQLAGRIMLKQKSGKILNMASMTSYFGMEKATAYAASKGAIAQLTKSLSNEWAPDGVCVNALAPGFIDTPFTVGITGDEDRTRYEFHRSRMAVGRWGRPDDVKGAAVFLCSAASDYITGILLPVDGGYLAK